MQINSTVARAGENTPATAPHPSTHERYRPELDGIRACCIIFTIFNHVPGAPFWINGSVGVDIFFALSGWLITFLLLREYRENGRIALSGFFVRRAFRILPLYYLTVLLYAILSLLGAKAGGLKEFLDAGVYMLTMCMEYKPAELGNLFGHAWTLGIEEKFYLGWPLILVATIRKPRLAAVGALLALATLFLLFGVTPLILRGYLGLGFGATLAMLVTYRAPVRRMLNSRAGVTPFLLLILVAYIASVTWRDQPIWNVLIAFGAALTIGSLWFGDAPAVSRWLSWGPLPWLGRLTYAIYLIQSICIRIAEVALRQLHIPQNALTIFVIAYLLAIAGAWCAHIVIEKPLIRAGKKIAATLARRETRGLRSI